MIAFGKENSEIVEAPFLVKAVEQEENGIRFIVALSVAGEKDENINVADDSTLNELLLAYKPIRADENNLYEITFKDYVFHMTRNESFTCWDDYEIRKGRSFIIFEKSRLLDCLPHIVELGIVRAYYPQGWKHYGIYCQNHIIDVIAVREPEIKKL